MEIRKPLYDRGDPIAWHATPAHGAGNGIVIEVFTDGDTVRYTVHQMVDGKPTNHVLEVAEEHSYPTRSLTDTRPQPAVHREFPRQ